MDKRPLSGEGLRQGYFESVLECVRFDKMLEPDVSKMLAKGVDNGQNLAEKSEFEREPPGARTLNLLIKSQLLFLLS